MSPIVETGEIFHLPERRRKVGISTLPTNIKNKFKNAEIQQKSGLCRTCCSEFASGPAAGPRKGSGLVQLSSKGAPEGAYF